VFYAISGFGQPLSLFLKKVRWRWNRMHKIPQNLPFPFIWLTGKEVEKMTPAII
jgi:hypothetical protein